MACDKQCVEILVGTVLILFVVSESSLSTPSNQRFVKLLLDLTTHFRSGSVYFLQFSNGNLKTNSRFVSLQKLLSPFKTSALIYNHEEITNCANSPLIVMFYNNKDTAEFLRKISTSKMSYFTWLLILDVSTHAEENILKDVYIPYDCVFLVASQNEPNKMVVKEIFNIGRNTVLHEQTFSYWNENSACSSQTPLYGRRNDLGGAKIRVAFKHNPPINDARNGGNIGFLNKIWKTLEHEMKFKTQYVPEEATLETYVNESWHGMIQLAATNVTDVVLNGITMTSERLELVDFMIPTIFTSYRVFLKSPSNDPSSSWFSFWDPLSYRLRIMIVGFMALLAVLLRAFSSFSDQKLCLRDTTFYILGIFCNQGVQCPSRSSSCRILFITGSMTIMITMAAYSACITSMIAAQRAHLPFTTLEGLLNDGTYQLGTVDGSAEKEFFSNAADPILREIYLKNMVSNEANFPDSIEKGMERICQEKFAFLTPVHNALGLAKDLPCEVTALPQVFMRASLAIVIQKDNPFKGFFNQKINQMRDGGILQQFAKETWAQSLTNRKSTEISVTITDVAPLLILHMSGVLISIIILIFEIFCHSYSIYM